MSFGASAPSKPKPPHLSENKAYPRNEKQHSYMTTWPKHGSIVRSQGAFVVVWGRHHSQSTVSNIFLIQILASFNENVNAKRGHGLQVGGCFFARCCRGLAFFVHDLPKFVHAKFWQKNHHNVLLGVIVMTSQPVKKQPKRLNVDHSFLLYDVKIPLTSRYR